MKVVLITSLEKEFDKKLARIFAREGYKTYAIGNEKINGVALLPSELKEAAATIQNESGLIDIYIDVSDKRSSQDNFDVRSGINEQVMRELYNANVIKPMSMLETFFPLLETGQGKRICYITSAQASINETKDTNGYAYKMAKAALHNFLQITRNALAPKNYTIRVYDPMDNEISAQSSAEAAFNYFTRGRGVERGDEKRDDENNLVFRDAYGKQHAW
ncbi:MAG: SDR family NAD(P)-dependent oxidoreductase [Treponema sp.]|nr:SDR family NAD(P)-dependent oxidoreductase [Treponema sp.]